MTRPGRALLPLLVGLALPAAVAWLVVSVVHLTGAATAYHVRVVDRPAGATQPTDAEVAALLGDQNRWGESVMFAVAAVALCLVLSLVTWLLGGPRRDRR